MEKLYVAKLNRVVAFPRNQSGISLAFRELGVSARILRFGDKLAFSHPSYYKYGRAEDVIDAAAGWLVREGGYTDWESAAADAVMRAMLHYRMPWTAREPLLVCTIENDPPGWIFEFASESYGGVPIRPALDRDYAKRLARAALHHAKTGETERVEPPDASAWFAPIAESVEK